MDAFKALVADREGDEVRIGTRRMTAAQLPEGEVLVRVVYSSVNYKDGLASIPNGNIVKDYPFIPGIDLAGIVVSSEDSRFREGDEILVTGFGLGVNRFGGYSEYAKVPADWVVKLPAGLSLKEAMIFGTAGFTAAMSVQALQAGGVDPKSGPVLVTGATGGVGSVSIAILAKLGYEVVASTGKKEAADELLRLGATRVIGREELFPEKPRPLGRETWAGVVDCVGGKSLASILSNVKYGGTVAASGLTGGSELETTVFPFILRGIRLIGIDSVQASMSARRRVWELLASEYKPEGLASIASEISLEQIPSALSAILSGQSRGRVVVKL
ncbi:oxidoreductase [Cohnella herbarum]|uniref:Oxidoreductase n=1 Tax=Cohnella herbarum TaxID=2728023 RepID=A0A7Z2ZP93_9BACL|nr:oxidoreductase [Cohnella herbarum]QJD86645.1 oxidoreductase [Cohnella herbarum]